MRPLIEDFYDPATGNVSYVLADRIGGGRPLLILFWTMTRNPAGLRQPPPIG